MKRVSGAAGAPPLPMPEIAVSPEQLRLEVSSGSVAKHEAYGEPNEDDVLCDQSLNLYAVTDGMGSYGGGDVAAKTINATLKQAVLDQGGRYTPDTAAGLFAQAFHAANTALSEKSPDQMIGAVSAAVHIFEHDSEYGRRQYAVVGAVGDSKFYLQRGETVVSSTEECFDNHLHIPGYALRDSYQPNNVYNALSSRGLPLQTRQFAVFELQRGDRIVLMSDGIEGDTDGRYGTVNQKIPRDVLGYALTADISAGEVVDHLFKQRPNEKEDDKSALVIDVVGGSTRTRMSLADTIAPGARLAAHHNAALDQTDPQYVLNWHDWFTVGPIPGSDTDKVQEWYKHVRERLEDEWEASYEANDGYEDETLREALLRDGQAAHRMALLLTEQLRRPKDETQQLPQLRKALAYAGALATVAVTRPTDAFISMCEKLDRSYRAWRAPEQDRPGIRAERTSVEIIRTAEARVKAVQQELGFLSGDKSEFEQQYEWGLGEQLRLREARRQRAADIDTRRIATPKWRRQHQAAQAALQAEREGERSAADTIVIAIGAQHPLTNGIEPGEEFQARLTDGLERYRALKQANPTQKVNLLVLGNRHHDSRSKQTDKVALYDAGGKWLFEQGGVPAEDIYGKDWSDTFSPYGMVYSGAEEIRAAAAGFKALKQVRQMYYICSPGQQKRAEMYALAYGVPINVHVPERLKRGEVAQFHSGRLERFVLEALAQTTDPYGDDVLHMLTLNRRPQQGGYDTLESHWGDYKDLTWGAQAA